MGTANQQPAPDLASVLGALGITGGLSGGAYADPQDLPVFTGRKPRDLRQEYLTGGVREQDIPGNLPSALGAASTRRQSELEKEFYSTSEDELSDLQGRLWAGGFYSQGVRAEEIIRGDHDEQTYAAYQKAVQRAARFYAAGKELTLDEVIDMASGAEGVAGRGRGAGGRQPLSVELTNPDDLRYVAQRAAVAALGRGFKPEEMNRFISSFHSAQRAEQTSAYGAAESGGTTMGAASPQAAAEAFAQREAPTEAGAHDFVRVYDAFTKILGRRG